MTTQNDNEDASSSKVPVVTAGDTSAGDDAVVNTKSTETVIPSTPATTTTIMTIQLTLTALPGAPRIPLDVTLTDDTDTAVVTTSSDLRQLVSTRTNIPLSTLRLIYRGRLITDNTTDTTMNVITEYKLENGSVLHCMGKPSVTTTETSPEVVTASSTGTIAGNSIGSTPVTTNAAAPTSTVSATTTTTPASSTSSSSSSSVPSLQSALETMRASNAMTIYAKCVKTLQKVLVNIIDHPLEEKYRTIKVNNAAFQKHFHHVHNSTTVLLACGFRWIHPDEPENAAYTMNASPEQWPTLLQSKATIDRAVQQSTVTASSITASAAAATGPFGNSSSSSSSGNAFPFPFPPAGGAMPDPAALQQQIANVMSNPQQIQAMMQVRVFEIVECYHCSFFSHLSSTLLFLNFFTISYFMLYQGSYDSKYDSE